MRLLPPRRRRGRGGGRGRGCVRGRWRRRRRPPDVGAGGGVTQAPPPAHGAIDRGLSARRRVRRPQIHCHAGKQARDRHAVTALPGGTHGHRIAAGPSPDELQPAVPGQIAERRFAECHFAEFISPNVFLPMCFLLTCQKVEMLNVEMRFADMPFRRSAKSRNVNLPK